MEIKFYNTGEIENEKLKFAIICSKYKGKWILAKHKERTTWEIPGGHREKDEDINYTAQRELYEETGALEFEINPMYDYSVTIENNKNFGRVFYAELLKLGKLPEMEIEKIDFFEELPVNLTYPSIQPSLLRKVKEILNLS